MLFRSQDPGVPVRHPARQPRRPGRAAAGQHGALDGCAVLDGQLYGPAQVGQLAKLGNRDTLRAQLLGVLQAPASKLVRLLNEPGASFARVVAERGRSGAPADA